MMTKLPTHLESKAALKEAILGRDDLQFIGYPCLVCSGSGREGTYAAGGHETCVYCIGTGVVSDEVFEDYYNTMVKKWKVYAGDVV